MNRISVDDSLFQYVIQSLEIQIEDLFLYHRDRSPAKIYLIHLLRVLCTHIVNS